MARFRLPRFRFSLRTLFVVVTVCALACPSLLTIYKKYRERQQEQYALDKFLKAKKFYDWDDGQIMRARSTPVPNQRPAKIE